MLEMKAKFNIFEYHTNTPPAASLCLIWRKKDEDEDGTDEITGANELKADETRRERQISRPQLNYWELRITVMSRNERRERRY